MMSISLCVLEIGGYHPPRDQSMMCGKESGGCSTFLFQTSKQPILQLLGSFSSITSVH